MNYISGKERIDHAKNLLWTILECDFTCDSITKLNKKLFNIWDGQLLEIEPGELRSRILALVNLKQIDTQCENKS